MKRSVFSLFILFLPLSSYAQTWGVGMWGGMQSCPYQTRVGNGATNVDDGTKEIMTEIAEAQKQLRDKKSEKKKMDRSLERAKSDITKTLSDDYASFIFEHVENTRRCQEYKGYQGTKSDMIEAQGQEGPVAVANSNMILIQNFTVSEWNQYCDPSKAGSVSAAICTNPKFAPSEGRSRDGQSCKKGLLEYRKTYSQSQKLQRDIERLEDSLARSKEALADAKQDALDAQREGRMSQTEGDVCVECMKQGNGYSYQKPETDWNSVVGNVALGLGSLYMGYKTNQMVADSNASIGWPTNPYASVGYGYGFGAMATGVSQALGGGSGIYGAIGGGLGSGSFGCAGMNGGVNGMMGPYGGMNGNGMWGNPYGMAGMGTMAGGIFNSGMGPWGMNGYGSSMMGMNGMMGSMMGGSPMGSMMNMGGMMGMGGMSGMMMSGYPMGSMMGMGGMMSMGGMSGMMMSGYPMSSMMGTGSMMGMGSMTGYDSLSMQYQQQLMQLQMQQYQNYAQYQQQYQQQYMQKYQAVSSLQQEMYSLMSRIQQIQYGTGYSSYISGSGTLGTSTTGYYYSPSSLITPLPGSLSNTNTTTLNSR